MAGRVSDRSPRIVLADVDRRLATAADMSKARKLCKQAGVSFREWVAENTRFSFYTATRLARIGDKRDPESRLIEVRARNALANRNWRARSRIRRAGLKGTARCRAEFVTLDAQERADFISWASKTIGGRRNDGI